MDNGEDILDALSQFEKKPSSDIPPILERLLVQISKTGESRYPWVKIKPLFLEKLRIAMENFFTDIPTDSLPPYPNVENVKYKDMRTRILKRIETFNGAPFTIQRLCELLTNPRKHYKRTDKYLRGIEKNVMVVGTVDPFGRKVVCETKNMVNGLDTNGGSPSGSSPDSTSPFVAPTWYPNAGTPNAWQPHPIAVQHQNELPMDTDQSDAPPALINANGAGGDYFGTQHSTPGGQLGNQQDRIGHIGPNQTTLEGSNILPTSWAQSGAVNALCSPETASANIPELTELKTARLETEMCSVMYSEASQVVQQEVTVSDCDSCDMVENIVSESVESVQSETVESVISSAVENIETEVVGNVETQVLEPVETEVVAPAEIDSLACVESCETEPVETEAVIENILSDNIIQESSISSVEKEPSEPSISPSEPGSSDPVDSLPESHQSAESAEQSVSEEITSHCEQLLPLKESDLLKSDSDTSEVSVTSSEQHQNEAAESTNITSVDSSSSSTTSARIQSNESVESDSVTSDSVNSEVSENSETQNSEQSSSESNS